MKSASASVAEGGTAARQKVLGSSVKKSVYQLNVCSCCWTVRALRDWTRARPIVSRPGSSGR
jgi:hypothetical protein